jgi:hypothetical protein
MGAAGLVRAMKVKLALLDSIQVLSMSACMDVWNTVCQDLNARGAVFDFVFENKAGIVRVKTAQGAPSAPSARSTSFPEGAGPTFVCVAVIYGEAVIAMCVRHNAFQHRLYTSTS